MTVQQSHVDLVAETEMNMRLQLADCGRDLTKVGWTLIDVTLDLI